MTADLPSALMREGFQVLVLVGGPFMVALLVVGFLVGLMQAATQINDPAVGFLPRLAVGLGVAWVAGRWALENLAHYFGSAVTRMGERL